MQVLALVTKAIALKQDESQSTMDWLSNEILFGHALWSGLYSGLYSVSKKGMVPHPTDQCLGQWIVDDLVELKTFKDNLINNFVDTPISDY